MASISLKKNIVTSYLSQVYVIVISILVVPFYISEMGAEAYGLIGFFAMLQSIFALLDLGLTPTVGRETARYRAGIYTDVTFCQFYRTLNLIFICIALFGGGILYIYAEKIAEHWLNIEVLVLSDVIFALKVMAISASLRWMAGLYRGVVVGNENLVWLSGFNVTISTFRFILVLPFMWKYGATPTIFFSYQLAIALLEFTGLWFRAKCLKPKLNTEQKKLLVWSFSPIKPYLKFAISIAITSGLWMFVTQADKLIMSNLLTLENYGYFSLAVLVSSGIMMIGGPISSSILPRMANLEAEGRREELLEVYHNATQLITIIAGSTSIIFVFFSEPILYVWTGEKEIVKNSASILKLYSIGYGLIVIGAFPYYLQYALGKLQLHIIGSVLSVLILVSSLFYTTEKFGVIGAGYSWLIMNLLYFTIWTAVIHMRYIPGLHKKWLIEDILKLIIPSVIVAFLLSKFFVEGERFFMLLELALISLIVFASTIVFSSKVKEKLLRKE